MNNVYEILLSALSKAMNDTQKIKLVRKYIRYTVGDKHTPTEFYKLIRKLSDVLEE